MSANVNKLFELILANANKVLQRGKGGDKFNKTNAGKKCTVNTSKRT